MTTPKRGTSIERDNPFRPGGDIEKEVDVILRSSTISADTITIVDPSSPQYKKSNGVSHAANETAGEDDIDGQQDNNEQVVVSVNNEDMADITDSNDNLRNDKTAVAAPVEHNGRSAEEPVNQETSDKPKTKTKKKAKKTCNII